MITFKLSCHNKFIKSHCANMSLLEAHQGEAESNHNGMNIMVNFSQLSAYTLACHSPLPPTRYSQQQSVKTIWSQCFLANTNTHPQLCTCCQKPIHFRTRLNKIQLDNCRIAFSLQATASCFFSFHKSFFLIYFHWLFWCLILELFD